MADQFPHYLLPNYELSIWVDGNIEILSDLTSLFDVYPFSRDRPIGFFTHNRRNCIYEEGQEVIRTGKVPDKAVKEQLAIYRTQNYPANNGLVSGAVILRQHHSPGSIQLMNDWWKEIDTYTVRDQLSINFVMWKNKIDLFEILENAYENKYYRKKATKNINFSTNMGGRLSAGNPSFKELNIKWQVLRFFVFTEKHVPKNTIFR